MAFDTVRSNKMRSALTVLGVVIGITSIVGMTAMIRGFDQSLRDMIGAIGPNTIFVQRFGVTSFASGAEFKELLKRPNLDDLRCTRDRADQRHDSARRRRARRRRPADAAACVLRPAENQAARGVRHDGELRGRHEDPDDRGAVLQRHRGAVPEERRGARQHAVSAALRNRRAATRSASSCASAASASKSSACSTSGRQPAGSTWARTTSR